MNAASSPVATARDPRTAIRVASGRLFWPLEARDEEVFIEDIAHGLSHLCRFTGHTRFFYSVAQHSVLVSQLCPPEIALWGLLHDASEAYLGDISRPLKHTPMFAQYRVAEEALQRTIYRRFGLPADATHVDPIGIKAADQLALHIELRDLVNNSDPAHAAAAASYARQLVAHKPELARDLFVQRFHHLVTRK